jgi:hypothetical protein
VYSSLLCYVPRSIMFLVFFSPYCARVCYTLLCYVPRRIMFLVFFSSYCARVYSSLCYIPRRIMFLVFFSPYCAGVYSSLCDIPCLVSLLVRMCVFLLVVLCSPSCYVPCFVFPLVCISADNSSFLNHNFKHLMIATSAETYRENF